MKIASEADAAKLSVLRRLVGLRVRGRSGARVDRAISKVLGRSSGLVVGPTVKA